MTDCTRSSKELLSWLRFVEYAEQISAPCYHDEGDDHWRVRSQSGGVYRAKTLPAALRDFWDSEIRERDMDGNPTESEPVAAPEPGAINPSKGAAVPPSDDSAAQEVVRLILELDDKIITKEGASKAFAQVVELARAALTKNDGSHCGKCMYSSWVCKTECYAKRSAAEAITGAITSAPDETNAARSCFCPAGPGQPCQLTEQECAARMENR